MSWTLDPTRLANLPLLLAGPLLRQVSKHSVSVWVALKESATVTLEVLDSNGSSLSPPMKAQTSTVAVGKHLHMVVATAQRDAAELLEGTIYLYNISFDVAGKHFKLLDAAKQILATAFCYLPYLMPSFALPPSDLTKLRLMHGSCRKPNAEGPDALTYLDGLIAEYRDKPYERPHQLLLTGDQIYADEVAETLLLLLTDAGETLLGWPVPEQLPKVGRFPASSADKLPPGTRMGRIQAAGFTSDDTRSHLMSLGEYLAMYLFVWSDVLWPTDLPMAHDVASKIGVNFEELTFAAEIMPNRKRVDAFRSTLPSVRRVLANIPTYMICDDHEITDDWNLSRGFCDDVYGSELGRRVVQNGLVAYALCQAWGNTPMQFDKNINPQPAGAELLGLLSSYEGKSADIQRIVGIHTPDQLANHQPHYAVFHDSGALNFHYTIEGPSHQIIVTDTRTWRAFPTAGKDDHSDLLPPDQLANQIAGSPPLSGRLLLVVLTTNMPPIEPIRYAATVTTWITHENDFLDSWEMPSLSFDHLIVKLSDAIKLSSTGTVTGAAVLLSGDVHHSFASRISYHADIRLDDPAFPQPVKMVLAQLVSSALHNQSEKTIHLHKEGYESSAGKPGKGMIPHHVEEGYAGWNVTALGTKLLVGQRQISAPPILEPVYVDKTTATVRLVWPRDNLHDGLSEAIIQVKLTEKPHYRYRLDYLAPTAVGRQQMNPPTIGTGPADIAANKKAMDAYRQYDKVKNGQEIVGLNNIAEVTFQGDARKPDVVHHTVRWQEPKRTDLSWATYTVSLDPKALADVPAVSEP